MFKINYCKYIGIVIAIFLYLCAKKICIKIKIKLGQILLGAIYLRKD